MHICVRDIMSLGCYVGIQHCHVNSEEQRWSGNPARNIQQRGGTAFLAGKPWRGQGIRCLCPFFILHLKLFGNVWCMNLRPVCAWELCRISPPRFLTECHKRRLNQASFVLLYFALFAFSGLCSVPVLSVCLICLLSCIVPHEPTWMALCSLIVLMCC